MYVTFYCKKQNIISCAFENFQFSSSSSKLCNNEKSLVFKNLNLVWNANCIRIYLKHLRQGFFCENKLHLRCSTGFQIRLSKLFKVTENTIIRSGDIALAFFGNFQGRWKGLCLGDLDPLMGSIPPWRYLILTIPSH